MPGAAPVFYIVSRSLYEFNTMRIITITIAVAVLVIILLLTRPNRQSELVSLPPPFVHVGDVENMDMQALNIITGKLQPARKVHLRFEVAGLINAVLEAGNARARPILLTTITTFLGVSPLIFLATGQTKFLAPMAVSLGFGRVYAAVLILIALPWFYLIADDLRSWCLMKLNRRRVAVQKYFPGNNKSPLM